MAKMQMRCGQCGFRIVFDQANVGEPAECEQCGNLIRLTDQTAKNLQRVVVVKDKKPITETSLGPVVVALAGCVIAGLGQILLTQFFRGALILIGSYTVFAVAVSSRNPAIASLGVGFYFFIQAFCIVDAFILARRIRNGTPIGKWDNLLTPYHSIEL